MSTRRSLARGLLAAGTLGALPRPGFAQPAFPDRPVRFVVTYAPGGNADATIRVVAPKMSEILGQPVIVENRAGAGGSVAARQVARLRGDGYTVMLGANGPITVNPTLQPDVGYDPIADFSPVGLFCRTPQTFAVTPSLPARDFAGFLAHVRANPGRVTMGSPGSGSVAHLAIEMFNAVTGLTLQHVPYGSGGAALPDIISGNVSGGVIEISTVLPLHRENRARILAVTSARRLAIAPEIPTVMESGVANFRSAAFIGAVVPSSTPPEVIAVLQRAVQAAVADPTVRTRLEEMGSEMATPEEATAAGFAAALQQEMAWTREAARRAGLAR